MRNYSGISITLLENLTFVWIGLFALFVWRDKTIWYVPQTVTAALTFVVYLAWVAKQRFASPLIGPMLCGALAMAALWYEMPLSSIADSTAPIMIFTLPVFLIWSLRNIVCFQCRNWAAGSLWAVVLVIGCAIFLPMQPVRKTNAWNQDPDAVRHSTRAAIAAVTIFLSAVCIAFDRLLHLRKSSETR